jgi:hypothetical protein
MQQVLECDEDDHEDDDGEEDDEDGAKTTAVEAAALVDPLSGDTGDTGDTGDEATIVEVVTHEQGKEQGIASDNIGGDDTNSDAHIGNDSNSGNDVSVAHSHNSSINVTAEGGSASMSMSVSVGSVNSIDSDDLAQVLLLAVRVATRALEEVMARVVVRLSVCAWVSLTAC